MLVIINIALALIFASIYSSIWRRITGMDLDFAELIAIASAYIIVSVGIGRIIHFTLLTSLFAFGIGIWGVLKVVSSAINSQKGYRLWKISKSWSTILKLATVISLQE